MFSHRTCCRCPTSSAHRLERQAAWFPMERVRELTGRHREAYYVRVHIVRLNDVLRIQARGIAPATKLDVNFAVVLIGSRIIPGENRKGRRRLEPGSVTD